MTERIDFALLRLTREGYLPSQNEVEKVCRFSLDQLASRMAELGTDGGRGHFGSPSLALGPSERLNLAQTLLKDGVDPERVAECLRWQEFEILAETAFVKLDFKTKRHFVFRHGDRRNEIDLVGWRDGLLMAVDCKHWDYGWSPSRIRSAVQAQRERVRSLAHEPRELARITSCWQAYHLLPVMVALRTTGTKIVEGTPLVPILRLGSFLSAVNRTIETLRFEVPWAHLGLNSWISQSDQTRVSAPA